MFVDATWLEPGGERRSWVGRIVRVDRRGLVARALAEDPREPRAGTTASLTTSAGIFETTVRGAGRDNTVEFVRPAGIDWENKRVGQRVRVRELRLSWWPEGQSDQRQALYVVDMSVSGVRAVAQRLEHLVVGARMAFCHDGLPGVVEVRSIVDHEHPQLAYYGAQFVQLDPALRRLVADFVASARRDPSNFA